VTFGILVESGTFIHDDIDVSEGDTSDSEHILVESSMLVQIARYSLAIPMIEEEIEIGTFDIGVIIFSKPSEFSCVGCDYVVASNFFSSSELMKLFTVVHHDTPNFSSFSEYLKLFFDVSHIFVGLSDVIPLAVSDVRPLRKPIYLFTLSLRGIPRSLMHCIYLLYT